MSQYGRLAYETLQKYSLAPKKRFGQNFLVHRDTAEAIVRAGGVSEKDTIVEVGVGLGALTVPLARTAENVIGFEIDSGIIRFHQTEQDLPPNVKLVHQDILKADFAAIHKMVKGRLKILANLPYSISNPFIFKLIDNAPLIKSATVMLQKEVAERLRAEVNTKDYGVPTVLLATCAKVTKKLTLKPQEFYPKPKVDSEVITIEFFSDSLTESGLPEHNYELLKKIVKATFNQRRKTLLNTLSRGNVFGTPFQENKTQLKSFAAKALKAAEISPSSRPETLTPEEFILLSLAVENIIKNNKSPVDLKG